MRSIRCVGYGIIDISNGTRLLILKLTSRALLSHVSITFHMEFDWQRIRFDLIESSEKGRKKKRKEKENDEHDDDAMVNRVSWAVDWQSLSPFCKFHSNESTLRFSVEQRHFPLEISTTMSMSDWKLDRLQRRHGLFSLFLFLSV